MQNDVSQAAQHVKLDAMRFAQADSSGDNCLDWEEFLGMQPSGVRKMHGDDQIREWFEAADEDGDGTVSINEFFTWTLHRQTVGGSDLKLRAIFAAHDKDGSRYLDAAEFQKLADEIGFGAVAQSMFREFDVDGSGSFEYTELLERLCRPDAAGDAQTKQFLMAMAWSQSEKDAQNEGGVVQQLDLASWNLDANHPKDLVRQLRACVKERGVSVADLLEAFNFGNTLRVSEVKGIKVEQEQYYDIDRAEFIKAMRTRFNYRGPLQTLRDAFQLLGGKDDGKIDPDELFQFVTGRANAMQMSKLSPRSAADSLMGMKLELPSNDGEGGARRPGAEWTVDELRRSIQEMCIKHKMAPHFLMAAWDADGNGSLSRNELLARVKRLIVSSDGSTGIDLWYTCVRETVKRCFDELAGKDRAIDMVEFSQFVNKDWPMGDTSFARLDAVQPEQPEPDLAEDGAEHAPGVDSDTQHGHDAGGAEERHEQGQNEVGAEDLLHPTRSRSTKAALIMEQFNLAEQEQDRLRQLRRAAIKLRPSLYMPKKISRPRLQHLTCSDEVPAIGRSDASPYRMRRTGSFNSAVARAGAINTRGSPSPKGSGGRGFGRAVAKTSVSLPRLVTKGAVLQQLEPTSPESEFVPNEAPYKEPDAEEHDAGDALKLSQEAP